MTPPTPSLPRPVAPSHHRQGPGPAKILTFEGPDGTGKSTLARAVEAALRERGVACRLWREPGSAPLAEQIRSVLRSPALASAELSAAGAQQARDSQIGLLMQAARSANYTEQDEFLRLHPDGVVLRDRSWPSTVAYQYHLSAAELGHLIEHGCGPGLHPALYQADQLIALSLTQASSQPRHEVDGLDLTGNHQLVELRYATLAQQPGWITLGGQEQANWLGTAARRWATAQGLSRPELLAARASQLAPWLTPHEQAVG